MGFHRAILNRQHVSTRAVNGNNKADAPGCWHTRHKTVAWLYTSHPLVSEPAAEERLGWVLMKELLVVAVAALVRVSWRTFVDR